MSVPNDNEEKFDVFLCHNSEDKPAIREIAHELIEKDITPWLDEEQIRPGTSWQTALEEQIHHIKSAAVFVGESGIGPWQSEEIKAFLSEFVERKCPIIPVLLPTAKGKPNLPILLKSFQLVDFREAKPDPLKQLIWGITGQKPDDQSEDTSFSVPDIAQKPELFPPQKDKVIELRLSRILDELSDKEQNKFIQSMCSSLDIADIKFLKVAAGRVRLYLELNPEDADKLYSAEKEGRLADLGISEARLYPAIANPPEGKQRSQLLILLNRVNEYWIEGVLKNSLHHEVLISLGKRAMDEAVEPPWTYDVELPSQRRNLILQDRNINSVFNAIGDF